MTLTLLDSITTQDIQSLARQCSSRAPTGIRNRALIAVLYRASLRVAEALNLRMSDYEPTSGRLLVHPPNERLIGIDPELGAMLERWVETRETLPSVSSKWLFC